MLAVGIFPAVGRRRLEREETGAVALGDDDGGDARLGDGPVVCGGDFGVGGADFAEFVAADFGVLSGVRGVCQFNFSIQNFREGTRTLDRHHHDSRGSWLGVGLGL